MNRFFVFMAAMLFSLPFGVFAADDHVFPLHEAVMDGDLASVQDLLVKPGTDVNAHDMDGWTPLHCACGQEEPCSEEQLLILKALLAVKGIQVDARSNTQATPLLFACQNNDFEAVQVLLAAKANVNVQDDNVATPLNLACFNGHLGMVNALLTAGAEVNAQGGTYTTLDMACFYGRFDVMKVLLTIRGTECMQADTLLQNSLALARKHDHVDMVDYMERFVALHNGLNKARSAFLTVVLGKESGIAQLDFKKPLKEQLFFRGSINADIIRHILSYLTLHACAGDEALAETYYHKQGQP